MLAVLEEVLKVNGEQALMMVNLRLVAVGVSKLLVVREVLARLPDSKVRHCKVVREQVLILVAAVVAAILAAVVEDTVNSIPWVAVEAAAVLSLEKVC